MASGAPGRRSVIEGALLDYQRSPGKYPLLKREPAVLFTAIKEVLQLAGGRGIEGEREAPSAAVQQAAAFFVRSALLHASADYYAVLGLEKSATAEAVKDRYRLMMRLMHPDFATSVPEAAWPDDTAARVNRAYEVLSSPERRKAYDESREPAVAAPAPQRPQAAAQAMRAAAARPPTPDPRRSLKVLAAVSGSVGIVLSLWIVFGSADRESLVQREAPAQRTAPVAVQAPEAAVAAAAPQPGASHVQEPAARAEPQAVARLPEPPPPPAVQAPAPLLRITTSMPAPAPVPSAQRGALPPVAEPARPLPQAPGASLMAAAPQQTEAVVALPAPVAIATAGGQQTTHPTTATPVVTPNAASKPNPGVTLAEVHPLLDKLVQQFESGVGDRIVGMLERDARNAASTQALLRHYNSLVEGARQVKVSHVQFRSEPLEGRLLVTGHLVVDVLPAPATPAGREFSLQAEFAARDGGVVMTRLSRPQGAAAAHGRSR